MGHGAEIHLRTYAHAIDAISGERHRDLDALISAARAGLGFRQCSATGAEATGSRAVRLSACAVLSSWQRGTCRGVVPVAVPLFLPLLQSVLSLVTQQDD
jgi:hypothetical protein